jgi:L-lactate dehydrogenase complex protein LldG
MADRNQFLATIREAAARGRAHRVSLNPHATAEASYVGGGADRVGTLIAEWTAVGGRGFRVRGVEAAREFLNDFVRERRIKKAIRWRHPVLERIDIDAVLAEQQIEVAAWDDLSRLAVDRRQPIAFAADLGITSVSWAVAETGTLALASNPDQGRVVSLLPPVFLAILEPSQIVPDLFDLFAALEPTKSDLPSNITLITGPSKTGDIELKLTTGVHGPGDVTVLVVE